MINIPKNMPSMDISIERRQYPSYHTVIHAIEEEEDTAPWYQDILNFNLNGEYPLDASPRAKRALRLLSAQFIIIAGKLYKRAPDGLNLLCISQIESKRIMEETHNGVCGPHMNG